MFFWILERLCPPRVPSNGISLLLNIFTQPYLFIYMRSSFDFNFGMIETSYFKEIVIKLLWKLNSKLVLIKSQNFVNSDCNISINRSN